MGKRYPFYTTIKIQQEKWFPHFRFLCKDSSHFALLESGRDGRYSIMGLNPVTIFSGKDGELDITTDKGKTTLKGNPLTLMRDWMKRNEVEANPDLPLFQGGAIGYISYDYARYIEVLPELSNDDLNLPDIYFMVFNEIFIYDHNQEMLYLVVCMEINNSDAAELRLSQLKQMWERGQKEEVSETSNTHQMAQNDLEVSLSAVERIQEYISQGDIFQVNLSVRQAQILRANPIEVYAALREVNPSPYMAYIQTPELQVVSGSPELLIKKSGDVLSTRPIAGTRSRGNDFQEDEKLARELIDNEKERAEHVMLVDLERNDLGRVCQFGSVEVDEFMVIERYSHVMHIVSNVKGILSPEYDVIDAVFPGGTITGAPKVRTMEIIEELEPVRRGLYTGSIGWIGYNSDMELNIAIRTMTVLDGKAYIQAGAGVVIDSNPVHEFNESLKKAKALWKAKEIAEEKSKITIAE
jgi:para-aminobenzoate synthetase component 1